MDRAVPSPPISTKPARGERGVMKSFRVQRLLLVGDCAVYHRLFNEPGLNKYFVIDATRNETLAEFKTRKQANKYAIANSDLHTR